MQDSTISRGMSVGWAALALLGAGCLAGWANLPRTDTADKLDAVERIPVRSYPAAKVQALLSDRTKLIFDPSGAADNTTVLGIKGVTFFERKADGQWQFFGIKPPLPVAYLFETSWRNYFTAVTVGKSAMCYLACDSSQVVDDAVSQKSAAERFLPLCDPANVKVACFDIGPVVPAEPYRVTVDPGLSGPEVYWVPISQDGTIDRTRSGAVAWPYFDLYHPKGTGSVAKLTITP